MFHRLPWVSLALALAAVGSASNEVVVGNVRIQFLSPTLVRIEQRGPEGFENRDTFTVVQRNWTGVRETHLRDKRGDVFRAENFDVVVPSGGESLAGVTVLDHAGRPIFAFAGVVPPPAFLPAPGATANYVLADAPRIVPPAWGATPAPQPMPNSGWDLNNQAPDIYVFVDGGGGYTHLRQEFLRLTGPTELPPLFEFGFTNSRYNPYTEATALAELDGYRQRGIPLDTFVIDTDWRVGGSHGYEVDKSLFPDMDRFLQEVHARHARTMFNDHPEPVGASALDPKEIQYRWDGLTGMLRRGVDVWWYDRNWGTHIQTPAVGLPLEVWGMRVYHDITERFRPNVRPLIMTNAYGIDNGHLDAAPPAAAHRYPVWWTGDTSARWEYLRRGIANGIDQGVAAAIPYVNEDLGGHVGRPTPELYVRYLEYGSLSPVMRVHCTRGQDRLPWTYGSEAEKIVTDYIKLRYRLLPTIYAAARRNYEDGTPLLRRCDLVWPSAPEARDESQYLFGDDLLVAPIIASREPEASAVPATMFAGGLRAEYFNNEDLRGDPVVVRQDANIDFDWGNGSPDPKVPVDHFSARWTGVLGPVAVSGDYKLATTTDDGVRLWLDGKQLIDKWIPQDSVTNTVTVHLDAGKSYPIRVEFLEITGQALCHLTWLGPSRSHTDVAWRQVWMPPGQWENLWTGERVGGGFNMSVSAPLAEVPMWLRQGGMVFLGPDMQYTGEKPWDPVTIEAFPGDGETTSRTLYEDDGISPAYKRGGYAKTEIQMTPTANGVRFEIAPRRGKFAGMKPSRAWVIRVHLAVGTSGVAATENGKAVAIKNLVGPLSLSSGADRVDVSPILTGPGAPARGTQRIIEVDLPAKDVSRLRTVEIKFGKG
ncbi:MAG: TIM-barrel domain-containing protein [Fimbriimonadaceae bacterium]